MLYFYRYKYEFIKKNSHGANEVQYTSHMHNGINHISPWMGIGTLQCVKHNAQTHQMI